MDKSKITTSRVIGSSVLEPKDELDEKLEKCYAVYTGLTSGKSERESNDALNAHISRGHQQYEEVQLGLFYVVLTDPPNAGKCYRDLTLLTRDGMNLVLTRTNQIIHEKWIKLQDTPREQILWFARELVKNAVTGSDSICHSLMRQVAGGDVSQKNIWLAETLLDILTDQRTWVDKFPVLLATAVYTYLRVIVDHGSPSLANLRQKEVEFCVSVLREKWNDCMMIGRDLVRLLQYVARIPEIEKLWRDILHNPTVLDTKFTGIEMLMKVRTSRKFFVTRLTPDMENKLVFLTTKVRFGQQKRYQDWFQRQYLSTPESQSLRCDLIRYICAVIHPSNELLCSDIIPRWAVIGWLLTTCTSNVAASNAKLSLFYDWLFFDPEKDSIMNIEPCILVMYHSMRPHPAITATLLDFMCRIMSNFYPPLADKVKTGIFTSLRMILEKKVLQSFIPLFDNAKLDKELRAMIREKFTEFCSQDVSPIKEEPPTIKELDLDTNNHMNDSTGSLGIAEFSDEEEEDTGKLRIDLKFHPIKEPPKMKAPTVDITDLLERLENGIKQCVIDFQNEQDNFNQCEIMDRLIQTLIQEDFEQDTVAIVASCLCQLIANQFNNNLFPQDLDEESIEDSIGTPLFVIYRNLCQTAEEDPSRQPILLLLEEMYSKQPRIGYNFLYFLKVSKVHDDKMAAYKDFCKSLENKDIRSCLMEDLRYCQEDDVRLFTYLIPDIYTQFPNIAIGNADLLHLIVSAIDGLQLQELVCQILQGHLVMFRKDSFLSILNASLEWETIEQYFLWQFIAAHNIPVEHIMPILPKLEFTTHAEALSSVLIQLKQDCPTADLLRPIFCRECKKQDMFTVSILKYWAQEYEDRLADLIYSQITKITGTPNRKRKQVDKKKDNKENPTVEQILSHLEHMRQTCKNISFLTHETVQNALQQVQQTSGDSLKAKYGDLLALVEDFDDVRSTRVLRAVPSRRASASAAAAMAASNTSSKTSQSNSNKLKKIIIKDSDSETEEESSEDEDLVKPKPKKRKKVTIDDDSD